MIEWLQGNLLSVDDAHIVMDVGGVGYALDIPNSSVSELPEVGESLTLHVSMIVREDAMFLCGFATRVERSMFEIFRNVSGIGPRTALDILSTVGIGEVKAAIAQNNPKVLERVPGIGRKKAERLILELKDKLAQSPSGAAMGWSQALAGERRLRWVRLRCSTMR